MYRTLLVGVWLSSGRSNVKVPHLALQGVSTEFVLIETHREGNVPHVARSKIADESGEDASSDLDASKNN